jgi:hypothetical protein
MVLIGEGKSFKYEFDESKARMPALAAVSPNRETGPKLSDQSHGMEIGRRDYLGRVQLQVLDSISNILRLHTESSLQQ